MTLNNMLVPIDHTDLKCDLCGSEDIANEVQGYVCRDCGIVLTVQKLQYDIPYNNDILQNSIQVGTTQIGTVKERSIHPHSNRLKRMSRYNSQLPNRDIVEIRVTKETSRIFESLSLPKECKH